MSTTNNDQPKLDSTELRRLKGIGHDLKPVVIIGNKGLSESVVDELDRALNDHELIKIKTPPGSKEERDAFNDELAHKTGAYLVHSIGRMALLLRRNPHANPKLSNLSRYSD